jgi:hypothetical protein
MLLRMGVVALAVLALTTTQATSQSMRGQTVALVLVCESLDDMRLASQLMAQGDRAALDRFVYPRLTVEECRTLPEAADLIVMEVSWRGFFRVRLAGELQQWWALRESVRLLEP